MDTDITIKDGAAADRKVDTRTVGAGVDEHRQVIIIGDPTTAADVASADAANGLDVDVTRVSGVVTVGGVAAADAAVSGNPVLAGGRASSVLPTAVSANGDAVPLWLDGSGAIVTTQRFGSSPTLSNVAGSATNVTLLGANSSRRSGVIVNDSAAILYIKEGATASTTSYSYKLQPDDTLILDGQYSGIIDGIWSSATGAARMTEHS